MNPSESRPATRSSLAEFRRTWALMDAYERFEQIVALTLATVIAAIVVVSLIQLIRTVFELLIVIIIVAVLMVVAIQKLLALQVDAERVVMESVVGTLRSAVGIKVAESIARQNVATLVSLEGSNPMRLLAETPRNYLGELTAVLPEALEPGNWYFDGDHRMLVYLVDNRGHFTGGVDNPPRARFQVRLVYNDANGNGRYDTGEMIEGLRLAPVESYRWIK